VKGQINIDAVPKVACAEYIGNRLWAVKDSDSIYASDILDPFNFDYARQSFQANAGDGQKVTKVLGTNRSDIVIFKENSTWLLSNIFADFGNQALNIISTEIGCIAPDTAVQVGSDIFFLSRLGLHTIGQVNDNSLQAAAVPLSAPVNNMLLSSNWTISENFQGTAFMNYYLLAVAPPGGTENSRIFAFDIVFGKWIGYWELPDFAGGVLRFSHTFENNVPRLGFLSTNGNFYRMFREEYWDEDTYETCAVHRTRADIAFRFISRAYGFQQPFLEKSTAKVEVAIAGKNPCVSVELRPSERIFSTGTVQTEKTYSDTAFEKHGFAKLASLNNKKNDLNLPYRENYSPCVLDMDRAVGENVLYVHEEGLYIDAPQFHRLGGEQRDYGDSISLMVVNSCGVIRIMRIALTAQTKQLGRET
jgi:hypothetical protein